MSASAEIKALKERVKRKYSGGSTSSAWTRCFQDIYDANLWHIGSFHSDRIVTEAELNEIGGPKMKVFTYSYQPGRNAYVEEDSNVE